MRSYEKDSRHDAPFEVGMLADTRDQLLYVGRGSHIIGSTLCRFRRGGLVRDTPTDTRSRNLCREWRLENFAGPVKGEQIEREKYDGHDPLH